MTVRRSRFEMTLGVLYAVADGIEKPTNVMYKVGLSYAPTINIILNLMEKGFIRLKDVKATGRSRRRYEATEKGKSIVRYLEGGKKFFELVEY